MRLTSDVAVTGVEEVVSSTREVWTRLPSMEKGTGDVVSSARWVAVSLTRLRARVVRTARAEVSDIAGMSVQVLCRQVRVFLRSLSPPSWT